MDIDQMPLQRDSTTSISSQFSDDSRESELCNLEWYHPNISRHVAETLLLNNGDEGAFLLRDKTGGVKNTDFVLSVRAKEAVSHYETKWDTKHYNFGFGKFKSLQEFHDHMLMQPLVAGESGVLTVLKYPYPKSVDEPSIYATVKIHATMGRNRSIVGPKNLSLATKEGYLTKRGGNVKNWKTRWFTVHGVNLKYYKDRSDKNPIRTLNLTECSSCQLDTSLRDKDHCFSLVFPWRTFYLCATTKQEAEEWIQLLCWKITSKEESDHVEDAL